MEASRTLGDMGCVPITHNQAAQSGIIHRSLTPGTPGGYVAPVATHGAPPQDPRLPEGPGYPREATLSAHSYVAPTVAPTNPKQQQGKNLAKSPGSYTQSVAQPAMPRSPTLFPVGELGTGPPPWTALGAAAALPTGSKAIPPMPTDLTPAKATPKAHVSTVMDAPSSELRTPYGANPYGETEYAFR